MKQSVQRYSVKILSHEIIEKKVYYIINVYNIAGGEPKETRKRFSEIESMHQKILDWINIFKIRIQNLNFPKKKIFFHTNQSEESILKRRGELQSYFNQILTYSELLCLDVVEEMLPKEILSQKQFGQNVDRRWYEIQQLKEQYLAKHSDSIFSLPQKKIGNSNNKQQYIFKFQDHSIIDDCILYTIEVNDTITKKRWMFGQRYQDIRDYHKQLKNLHFDFPLPDLPEKRSVSLKEVVDLWERKSQLEYYLNRLFSYQIIVENDVMVFFIAKSQLDGNEIGCRSQGNQKNILDYSSIQSKSQTTIEKIDDEKRQSRQIVC
ncbi:unnamed protein product [Paramecium sonneborni]|uniref:PX domain-containing protein n=1 Tax=Paramecium sonneborni TaxID=65129 RepID=A0A8S1NRX3_9CILI|nr:unnamed protein product [Paramecium sonneborni]